MKNELKYLEELSNTSTYKEDTSLKQKCEGEITIEECKNDIFKMKLNKAPGLDGLSVEFYKKKLE